MRKLSLPLGICLLFICSIGWSQTLPAGFTTSTIGSGWNLPLGTAFTTDGQKLFVWEKEGRVYVCSRNAAGNYIKQTTPVLDISEEVANWGDHGIMGFALDPNYLSNGLIYLLYVVDRHYLMNFGTPAYNPATSSTGATIGRITRYKTITSGNNLLTDLSSRMILLGETRSTGIVIMHDSHGMGTLAFAADGTLMATAGDGGSYYTVDKGSDSDTDYDQALMDGIIRPAENVGAFRAQMLNCHSGKLLRIDPVTGNGVSSNPYYSAAQPRSAKSRVWAFGLRNPYRFSIKPGTGSTNPAAGDVGEIYVGDVGWNNYEEVNVITTAGVNCGWPLFEGLTPVPGYTAALTANRDEPNPLFGTGGCTQQFFNFQDLIKQATADNSKTVYNPCNPAIPIGTGNRFFHQRPIIDWKHFTDSSRVGIFSGNNAATAQIGSPASNVVGTPFAGNCAIGGPWYSGSSFPAAYQNRYFVADHDAKWIKCFSVDFTDVVTEVKNFGNGFLGTVSLTMNPLDGSLFVVELGNFSTILPTIKQIRFGGNQSPIVRITSNKTFGPSALAVNFTGNTSSDPDGTIASYAWNFGDGATSTSANPSHNFTAPANTPKKYVVKLTVTDNLGASSLDSIIISVNNTPPVVNITSPIKNSLYKIGPDTLYTCSANVSDAEHSAAALKYEWQTFLRHNSHVHPEGISTAISPTTSISRIGCNGDTYYWFIQLTVTDAAGLSAVDSSKIFPDCNVGADITPPTVSSISPVNGATSVSFGTIVSAVFNETIDPVTVTGSTFGLKDAGNNIIPGAINTSFNQLTIIPSAALAGSTVYTATIKGGASGVKDLAGNALANDYTWTFTTAAVDNTPPTVTTVSPVNGGTNVSINTTAIINFSEAINVSTINGTTFQLKDAGNNVIAAALNTSASQVTLTPAASLAGSAIYSVTIKSGAAGVKDLAGNALLNDYTWSFTTVAVDNTDPTVTTVSPVNGATAVSTGTTVIAELNEPINPSTVTAATFQLKDAGNNLVPATINTLSGQIILTPSIVLTNSAVYTATIKGGPSGVKDAAGNALASDYNWSFTTGTVIYQPPVTIQSFTTKTGIAATTHSLSGVPAGALLILATTADAVPSDCNVSSSPSLTWTKQVDAGATSSDNAEIWTARYSAGGSITVISNWGAENSQASVCYVVLNAEPVLGGAFGTGVLQSAPSVTITTTRDNSIIFGCTADWKAINGNTRTLRDTATERLYFKDGNFTTYHYTKAAASIAAYTEGVSLPTGQQASTSLLEIRGNPLNVDVSPTITTAPISQTICAGTNASFTSAASGTPQPTVQWQVSTDGTSWININGATDSILTFAATITDNNNQYRAVWTNSVGPVSSNPATLTVNSISAPVITIVNNCGSTVLTASTYTGSLLWSTGETSPSITVTTADTYILTQTVNGCSSPAVNGTAAPKTIPQLLGGLATSITSNAPFTYNAASTVAGTAFAWNRAAVTGVSNVASNGTGDIIETLVNTTGFPVNVTYVYTLTANGCSNTQNVVVTVNPVTQANCTINNTPLTSNFNAATIPAGRYIWFNSSLDPGPLGAGTDPVTINITNGVINFTANNVEYTLSVPNARIRFDASATSASTQFINNVWETVVPRNYTSDIFMSGLSYLVPVNFPGNYTNVKWTTNISIDKAGISVGWRWAAAVYSSLAAHSGINVKPINGSLQNPYANSDRAGTPENFKSFVVDGAKGTGGTNYTGSFSAVSANSCTVSQIPATACTINNTSLTSNFGAAIIPAGRYLWFNSSLDPGSLGAGTDPVTLYITNGVISFTANNVQYTLSVPNARIRFDASVTSASTQFINNVWETVVPRNYTSDVFMGGLSYLLPVNFPGDYNNVTWTTDVSIDKVGISLAWRWAAAVYTSFAGHAGINVKPINGNTQNPYANLDRAGTPENFKPFVVGGAKGTGGTNYTGSFSTVNTVACAGPGQRSLMNPSITHSSLSGDNLPKEELAINVMPNPSNTYFTLVIRSKNNSPVQVRVTNIFGQVMERQDKVASNTILRLGQRWSSGTYFVEIIQDKERRIMKIIKVN